MIQAGDWVRIKSWKEMEKEFGVDSYGRCIPCSFIFVREMKPLCGLIGQVASVSRDNEVFFTDYNPVLKQRLIAPDSGSRYHISTDMVKKIKPLTEEEL